MLIQNITYRASGRQRDKGNELVIFLSYCLTILATFICGECHIRGIEAQDYRIELIGMSLAMDLRQILRECILVFQITLQMNVPVPLTAIEGWDLPYPSEAEARPFPYAISGWEDLLQVPIQATITYKAFKVDNLREEGDEDKPLHNNEPIHSREVKITVCYALDQ